MIVWMSSQMEAIVMLISGWHLLSATLCSMGHTSCTLCKRNSKTLSERNCKLLSKSSTCTTHNLLPIVIFSITLLSLVWILLFKSSTKPSIKPPWLTLSSLLKFCKKITHNQTPLNIANGGPKLNKWLMNPNLFFSIKISLYFLINEWYTCFIFHFYRVIFNL